MSGFSSPAAGKYCPSRPGRYSAGDYLAHCQVKISLWLRLASGALSQMCQNRSGRTHIVPDMQGLLVRYGQREGLRQVRAPALCIDPCRLSVPECAPAWRAAVPACLEGFRLSILTSRSRGTCCGMPRTFPSSALLPHPDQWRSSLPAALGIGDEGALQLVGKAQVVHHGAARLVLKTRLTLAMACMRPCPRIGLSRYMV